MEIITTKRGQLFSSENKTIGDTQSTFHKEWDYSALFINNDVIHRQEITSKYRDKTDYKFNKLMVQYDSES